MMQEWADFLDGLKERYGREERGSNASKK